MANEKPFFTVRVQGKGLDIDQVQERLKKVLDQELLACTMFLLAEIQKATPVGATGRLRKGWFMRKIGERYVISNPHDYLLPLEKGRRAAPISEKGMVSLRLWVRRKLGVPSKDVDKVARLIALKKTFNDTPGQKFVEKTLARTLPRIIAYLTGPIVTGRLSGDIPPGPSAVT